jgi:hypothetical protein
MYPQAPVLLKRGRDLMFRIAFDETLELLCDCPLQAHDFHKKWKHHAHSADLQTGF